jgi:phospholipid/cholesterol/gamma-HCH transport system substrate-binding protein
MAEKHHWSELRTGIIAAAVIALIVTGVLLFARVGALHGKKVTLYVVTDGATGVLAGTEVWLSGRKVGLVKAISFRPPTVDTTERLLITTEFLEEALPNVRRDSYAQIRAGGSLIGTPIIYIAAGSSSSPRMGDGDTLRTRPKPAIGDLASKVGTLGPAITALVTDGQKLTSQISRPVGTLGNFQTYGLARMPQATASMSRVMAKATNGNGTVALAMRRDLMGRAAHAMAATDSIFVLMSSSTGSIGRFRRDTTLVTKAKGVMAELDTLRALASNPVAALGGARNDSTLARELARSRALLDSLMTDLKKHPFDYISF